VLFIYILFLLAITLVKKQRKHFSEMLWELFLSVYFITLLDVTGVIPINVNLQSFVDGHYMMPNMIPFVNGSISLNLLNLFLFLPFGFLLPIVFKKLRWTYKKIILCMFSLTFTIELLQLLSGRTADIDDILMNSLGGLIGFVIYRMISVKKEKNRIQKNGDI